MLEIEENGDYTALKKATPLHLPWKQYHSQRPFKTLFKFKYFGGHSVLVSVSYLLLK